MPQQPIELILMREVADHLSTPMFVVDAEGALAFYNEPAEALLGQRFEETGPMSATEWGTVFVPTDDNGQPLASGDLPLVAALRDQRPAHDSFVIRGLDGVTRRLEVAAVPLIGRAGDLVGAVALFWASPR